MSALATNCCLVNLTKNIPAVEDAIPKLVDVVAFADVNTEERIDDRLVTAASLATASQNRRQLDNSFSTFTQRVKYFLLKPRISLLQLLCISFG